MDTILTLEGQIGKDNLSTQAKKRISTYHGLKKQVQALERAYKDADENDKESTEEELDEAKAVFDKFNKATISFLQDELSDFTEKAEAKAKADKEKADKKKDAQEKADKEKADKEKADKEKNASGDDKDKPMNVTGFIIGGLVLIASFGAVNYWRNKN